MSKVKDLGLDLDLDLDIDIDIRRLIEIGMELEMYDYNTKFGINQSGKKLRKEGNELIMKLQGLGFDPNFEEYEYKDENGVS